jgi:tetratricopeptide (TPR) repeat protein
MRVVKRQLILLGSAAAILLLAGGALGALRLHEHGGSVPFPGEVAQVYHDTTVHPDATDTQIETLQSRLSQKASDPYLLAQLGSAYLQKARETGNPTYYGKAESVLAQSLALQPENADALYGMGVLALARHQFHEALDWGERAVKANSARAANYGIVGDAQVELGRYDDAATTVQKMVDTRPDLSSYSRVSYLRELHGQVDGAIDAMKRAVTAGGPFVENTAYVRVQLGNLYFNSGRLDDAEREYQGTLQQLPDYGPAMAGLGYVRAARGDDAGAIQLFTKASQVYPLPEYFIALGDLYTRDGRTDDANHQYDLVRAIERLFAANGVDVDVETALFDADHGFDPPATVARARQGYAHRPSIQGADVLAWSLYQAGRPDEAQAYAQEALRLGTKDALKFFHAGMIARALGQTDQARTYLESALAINPNFSILHAAEARDALAALDGPTPTAGVARSRP